MKMIITWKRLLKDKAGLTQSAKFLLTTAGVGAVAFYTLSGAVDEQVSQERAIRDLSSMTASSPYSGLRQSERGLSSINIKDARGQVATAREREAMERNSGANSDFGVSSIESLDSGSIGQAMQFSNSSDALSQDSDKGAESNVRFASTAPDMSGTGARGGARYGAGAGTDGNESGLAGSGYAGQGSSASAGAGQLGNASMARASGSASSSSYNPANPSGNAPVTKARGGESAYQMSGAMPEGSTMLAMGGSHNPKNSGFSSSRDLQAGRTQQNGRGKGDLDDIRQKSVAAAQNSARSANEGSRAFQAGQTSSSGLRTETFGGMRGASSSDLSTSNRSGYNARKTDVNKGKIDFKAEWIKRRDKAIEKLNETFTTNILIALGLIIGGAALLTKLQGFQKKPWPAGLLYWGPALILLGGVSALMFPIFKQAGAILREFSNPPEGVTPNNFGIIMREVLGGAAIGTMAAVTAFPKFAWEKAIKPLMKRVFVYLPQQVFGAVKNLFSSEMNKNYK